MTEYHIIGAAFVLLAGSLGWMAVLLKRELVPALVECWSDLLNGAAEEMR